MTQEKTVLVAGSQGVIGRATAAHWVEQLGTTVYGLSRRNVTKSEGVQHISVDLLNAQDVQAKLGPISDVTHIVFAAYIHRPTDAELIEPNVAMLRNLLDVVERQSRRLRHVTLYQGGKAYGAHLGPFKTPGREDDPGHMPPNFYYNQEDLLRERHVNERQNSWDTVVE